MFIRDDSASSVRDVQNSVSGDVRAVFGEIERELRTINKTTMNEQIRGSNDNLVRNNVLPGMNLVDSQQQNGRSATERTQQRVIVDETHCGTYTYGSASPEWQKAKSKVKEELKNEVKTGEVKVRYGVTVWDVAEANLKAHKNEKPTNAQILAETKRIEELNKICRADLNGVDKLKVDAPPTERRERREPTETPPRRTGDKVEQGTGTPKVDLPGGRQLELGNGHYVKTTFGDGNQKYEFDNGSGCTIEKRGDVTVVKQWGRRPEDNLTHVIKGNDEVVLRQDGSVAKKITYNPADKGLTTEHNEANGRNYTTTEWPNGAKRTTWKDTNGNTVGEMTSTDADQGKRTVRFGHPNQDENYTTVEYANGARRRENANGTGYSEGAPDTNGTRVKRYWGPQPGQNRTTIVDRNGREH